MEELWSIINSYKSRFDEDKDDMSNLFNDPKIISNDEIIDLSKKAMDEGIKNLETGEIENAYPVLEWEK